jgi:hypothetical protein
MTRLIAGLDATDLNDWPNHPVAAQVVSLLCSNTYAQAAPFERFGQIDWLVSFCRRRICGSTFYRPEAAFELNVLHCPGNG